MFAKRAVTALFTIAGLTLAAWAPAVAWQPETQRVPGTEIAALASKAVAKLVDGVKHIATPAFTVSDQMVHPGEVSLAAAAPQVMPSYINVPINISVNGHLEKTTFVGYRVLATMLTAVATRGLNVGTLITKDDVAMLRIATTYRPAVDVETLLGRKLITTVAKGQPVFAETTAVNEIVKAGQPCVIIVRDGPVSLAADVIARTSGGMGDMVAVWNPRTNRALSGTVTGPAQVELILPSGDVQ